MRNWALAIAAGSIVFLGLVGAVAAFGLLFQIPASPLPPLRTLMVQRQAQSQACQGPWHLVPGSYYADAAQTVGDWVEVTYTAECDSPGLPRQIVSGYVAMNSQGGACTGSGSRPMDNPWISGPVAFGGIDRGLCGATGTPGGLSIVTGLISGTVAVSVEVTFSGGATASGPIRNGRFAVLAPWNRAACVVRALDASSTVVAEDTLVLGRPGSPPQTCS